MCHEHARVVAFDGIVCTSLIVSILLVQRKFLSIGRLQSLHVLQFLNPPGVLDPFPVACTSDHSNLQLANGMSSV